MVPAAAGSAKSASASGAEDGSNTADERLAEVTLKVKEALDVSNDYTSFYGNYTESGYGVRWQLNWNSENEGLSVQADENGKIYSVNLYSYGSADYGYKYYGNQGFNPRFPKVTRAEAAAAAGEFLKKVMDANESVEFHENGEVPRDEEAYYFYGSLTVNGLKTDVGVNLTVRTSDLKVTSFYRDDGGYYIPGGYPAADARVTPEQALSLLKTKYTARAEYALVDGSKVAKLVYFVSADGDYAVDAKTGELVNINSYYAYGSAQGIRGMAEAAEYGVKSVYLTEAELKGVKYLEGVLSASELDKLVRAETAFGLTSEYVMGKVDYNVTDPNGGGNPVPLTDIAVYSDGKDTSKTEEKEANVTATFAYTLKVTDYAAFGISAEDWKKLKDEGNEPEVIKTFTLNAKTGEIMSCYTDYFGFGWNEKKEPTTPVISKTAEAYISKRYPELFGKTALYSSSSNTWSNVETYSFTYCQSVNGWFYPGNSIYVSINAHTGFVDGFSSYWDDTVTFAPAPSVAGEEAAVNAYMSAYKAVLHYCLLPLKKDSSGYYDFSAYKMLPAYRLNNKEGEKYISYIDAVTGEAVYYDSGSNSLKLAYNDIEGCYAKDEILKLAEYGIGLYAPSFAPDKDLTELDMILFLISAGGYKYKYGDFTEDTLNEIYSAAYNYKILEKGQREPGRIITRTDIAKSFVAMSGYSEVANFKGIFKCGFTDETDIPEKDYGYVAIAKGLGIITGDPSGSFRPNDAVTRQELAHMMYKYMSR
jgi:uncharacterized membrane protein YkoI